MKLKRLFFLILGCVCLALGCVGIVLPVLPTVPFFLATVFCFANSSEKLHTWFLGTELYQKHLDSFVKKKGMTAQTKAGILMSVTLLDGRRLFPDAAKSALHSLHYSRYCVALPPRLLHLRCEDDQDRMRGADLSKKSGRATGMLRRLCRFFEREGKIMLFRGAAGRRSSSRSRRRR